jgi:uncharacterized protein
MKKSLITFLFILLVVSGVRSEEVWTVQSVPNTRLKDARVCTSDPDDLLDQASQTEMDRLLYNAQQQLTAEIFVVALRSIGPVDIKSFATALFNEWGIGKAGKDNGLLILMVEDEHQVTFETGYGMESVLPDAICYRIIHRDIIPFMKQGEYGKGLLAGVQGALKVLSDPNAAAEIQADIEAENQAKVHQFADHLMLFFWGYLILTLVVLILSLFSAHKKLKAVQSLEPYDAYKMLNTSKGGYQILAYLFPLTMVLFVIWYRRKLKILRKKPRLCPNCGKALVLMNEQQEDAYLTAGQQSEEMVGSVDYDAWICMDCGHKSFLSYSKMFTKYRNCPQCGFKTYAQTGDHISIAPTPLSAGEGVHIFSCANCGHVARKTFIIPMIVVLPGKGGRGGSFGGGGGSFGGGMSGGGGATGGWN